jgi:hypothetical protein
LGGDSSRGERLSYIYKLSFYISFNCVKSILSLITTMASVKGEKPVGTQLFGQAKKQDPAPKAGDNATKAPASKAGAKKAAPKPQEPKKKVYI